MESCCADEEPAAGDHDEHEEHRVEPADLARIGLVAAAAALTWAGTVPRVAGVDLAAIAAAVGRELGVDESEGALLPEAKLSRVRALLGAGKVARDCRRIIGQNFAGTIGVD